MSAQPYSYCFLRYVHSPDAGEFANVGVLLWAPESRYLGFSTCQRYSRLSAFFHSFDADGYRNLMSKLEREFDSLGREIQDSQMTLFPEHQNPEPVSARDLATRIIPIDDACLQWSLSGGGETPSPEIELAEIFGEYIEIHNQSNRKGGRDERAVFNEVFRQAFEAKPVMKRIRQHEVVAPLDSHTFQQAWKNGVWNVYETLSFDLVEADAIRNKAHRWESRARLLSDAEEPLEIHFLLGAPQGGRNQNVYGRAKDILRSSKVVTLIEEDAAPDFATALTAEVRRGSADG